MHGGRLTLYVEGSVGFGGAGFVFCFASVFSGVCHFRAVNCQDLCSVGGGDDFVCGVLFDFLSFLHPSNLHRTGNGNGASHLNTLSFHRRLRLDGLQELWGSFFDFCNMNTLLISSRLLSAVLALDPFNIFNTHLMRLRSRHFQPRSSPRICIGQRGIGMRK